MKARLLACAVAGLACAVPVGAGAQAPDGPPVYGGGARYALPPDQISASVRAAGLEPLSRPVLRGAVYYMRAVNRARTEMRVAIDARSGRVLSTTRVATESPVPPAAAAEPAPAPRYEPYVSSRGYSEAAPLPPADVPGGAQPTPPPGRAPNYGVTSPAKRLAAQPPVPRARRGESGEVTGSVPEAPAAKPESPPSAPSAPSPVPAKPVMVPIAPLE